MNIVSIKFTIFLVCLYCCVPYVCSTPKFALAGVEFQIYNNYTKGIASIDSMKAEYVINRLHRTLSARVVWFKNCTAETLAYYDPERIAYIPYECLFTRSLEELKLEHYMGVIASDSDGKIKEDPSSEEEKQFLELLGRLSKRVGMSPVVLVKQDPDYDYAEHMERTYKPVENYVKIFIRPSLDNYEYATRGYVEGDDEPVPSSEESLILPGIFMMVGFITLTSLAMALVGYCGLMIFRACRKCTASSQDETPTEPDAKTPIESDAETQTESDAETPTASAAKTPTASVVKTPTSSVVKTATTSGVKTATVSAAASSGAKTATTSKYVSRRERDAKLMNSLYTYKSGGFVIPKPEAPILPLYQHPMKISTPQDPSFTTLGMSQYEKTRRQYEYILHVVNKLHSTCLHTDDLPILRSKTCAVCFKPFIRLDQIRQLPCEHVFHRHCVDPWLISRHLCPLCKCNVITVKNKMPECPIGTLASVKKYQTISAASQSPAKIDMKKEDSDDELLE